MGDNDPIENILWKALGCQDCWINVYGPTLTQETQQVDVFSYGTTMKI